MPIYFLFSTNYNLSAESGQYHTTCSAGAKYHPHNVRKVELQAGAELGQAQLKLWLDFLTPSHFEYTNLPFYTFLTLPEIVELAIASYN